MAGSNIDEFTREVRAISDAITKDWLNRATKLGTVGYERLVNTTEESDSVDTGAYRAEHVIEQKAVDRERDRLRLPRPPGLQCRDQQCRDQAHQHQGGRREARHHRCRIVRQCRQNSLLVTGQQNRRIVRSSDDVKDMRSISNPHFIVGE